MLPARYSEKDDVIEQSLRRDQFVDFGYKEWNVEGSQFPWQNNLCKQGKLILFVHK